MYRQRHASVLLWIGLLASLHGCAARDPIVGDWRFLPSAAQRTELVRQFGQEWQTHKALSLRPDGSGMLFTGPCTWSWANPKLLLVKVPPKQKLWTLFYTPDPKTGFVTIHLQYDSKANTLSMENESGPFGRFGKIPESR